MNIRIVVSTDKDVWKNFSVERYLINHINEDEIVLFLWQSSKNVMLGKNQNPWRECNVKLLQQEGGVLARRITGGGAIYCDLGNMLFSFIVPNNCYNLSKQLSVIIDACSKYGIKAVKTGRNDLTIDGRKFSGNAFYHNSKVSLHHGSLLIDEDVENMVRYLTPSVEKISSKGVQSVRSRVTNLMAHNGEISVDGLRNTIVESFKACYEHKTIKEEKDPEWFASGEVMEIYEHFRSWDWIYGNASEADVILERRFDWGEVQCHFRLDKSVVTEATVFSDALDQDYISEMPLVFKGIPFGSETLAGAIVGYGDNERRLMASKNISEWLLDLTI